MTIDFDFSSKMNSRRSRMGKKIFTVGVFVLGLALTVLNAQTWSPLRRLTWNSEHSMDVNIAIIWGDNLHLVWQDASTAYSIYEIFYKKSLDGGVNWSGTKRLTWTNSQSFNPAIAVDSTNNIYVVWEQYDSGSSEIYYKKSTNGGNSWTGIKRLTWTAGYSFAPKVAIDSAENIYVVWSDTTPGDEEIYFKKSTNGGNSWSSKRLSWNAGEAEKPKIVIDSNDDIQVLWSEDTPGNCELFYKKSIDGGNSWTATKRLTWTSADSYNFDVVVDSSDVLHVAWQDKVKEVEVIFYKKSTDSGLSWTGTKRLTWGTNNSSRPAIASDSANNIHVIWRKKILSQWYSFYRRANSSGIWGSTKRLTWSSKFIMYPEIAVDSSDKIHALWEDDYPGNYEIFYKKGIQ
jgi:hypothetical protein